MDTPARFEAEQPRGTDAVDALPAGDAPMAPSRRRRRWWSAVIVAVAVVLVAAGAAYWQAQPTALEAAYEACDYDDELGAFLADEGRTLLLETAGDEEVLGMAYADVLCAFAELEMPTRVITQIGATRALDGRVSDTWHGLTATWSYHPSSGLNLMITID